MSAAGLPVPTEEQAAGWEMKTLKPWHKQAASMMAQGIDRDTIATVLDCTPEYVSMLARQPKVREYIRDMCQIADLQLEGMFVETVKVIGDTLANGNGKERIQAARLQLEVTKRIGSKGGDAPIREDTVNRLARLAEKLLYLQGNTPKPETDIIDLEVIPNEAPGETSSEDEAGQGNEKWSHQSAQDDGDGLSDTGR